MRPLRILLVPLLLAVLVAGCGESSVTETSASSGPKTVEPGDSTEGVTLRVGVQKDSIRSILDASGALEGVPYEIDFSVFQFGPPLVEAASADKIDLAGVGSTPPIFGAAAEGASFRVVSQQQFTGKGDNALLVKEGSGIESPEDLKGKTVAIPKGSSAHGFFLRYLDRNEIDDADVDVEFLAPADGLAAFATDRVDAWAVWQPFIAQAEAEGATRLAAGPPDEQGLWFQVASTKSVEDPAKAAAIKDYLERLNTALTWARENPDEWARAWSKESGLPLETTREAVKERAQQLSPVTDEAREAEQDLADTLHEHGVIPSEVTFDDIVTSGLAPGGEAN